MMRSSIQRVILSLVVLPALTPCSKAAIKIAVDGLLDPQIDVYVQPGETAALDIAVDGVDEYQVMGMWLYVQGPGSISGGTLIYDWFLSAYHSLEWLAAYNGMTTDEVLDGLSGYTGLPGLTDVAEIMLTSHPDDIHPFEGVLVDDIEFLCEAPGDVTLTLILEKGKVQTVLDTQVIHQIPEPATLALLGLASVMLRNKRRPAL
ncbi:MAG: PEP-CTERM sorting domain-containing protein [Planctomycetota bacterium]|jgi:hypothetical protein